METDMEIEMDQAAVSSAKQREVIRSRRKIHKFIYCESDKDTDMLASSKKLEEATQHFKHGICSFTVVQSLIQCVELTEFEHFRAIITPTEIRDDLNGEVVITAYDMVRTLRNAGALTRVYLCVSRDQNIGADEMDRIKGAFSGIVTCPFHKKHLHEVLEHSLVAGEDIDIDTDSVDAFYDGYTMFTDGTGAASSTLPTASKTLPTVSKKSN